MLLSLDKLKVLVVDDDRAACMFAAGATRTAGVKDIVLAEGPEAGLRIFDTSPSDIVMASWEMKPYNGIEFTRKLRRPSSPDFTVPVILMVSLVSIQMVTEARDAGVTEFLCRPFSTRHIAVRLSSVISNPRKFIATDTYRGPCRRRTKTEGYGGPFRRTTDTVKAESERFS